MNTIAAALTATDRLVLFGTLAAVLAAALLFGLAWAGRRAIDWLDERREVASPPVKRGSRVNGGEWAPPA